MDKKAGPLLTLPHYLPCYECIAASNIERHSLFISKRLRYDLLIAEASSPIRVLWWRKEGDVPVVLIEDEVQVVVPGYFVFGKYFSKPRRSNVVSVEGHIGVLEVPNEP